jgi:Second Messenger Oligonucleotide or Dinucleotide Synthetase domain
MADVQAQFEQFHAKIRLNFDDKKELAEKRDVLVVKIKKYLKDNGHPSCTSFNQGSYATGVGIRALEGDEYDIDVGLRFEFEESEYDAATVHGWIYEAVKDHTDKVEEKGPCVRVTYADGYHVDLVAYAHWESFWSGEQYRLAHNTRGWVKADPPKLLEHVADARKPYDGTEDNKTKTDQFRRCVRALKRWNDVHLPGEMDDKPSGLALTLLAEKHLSPTKRWWTDVPNDRLALQRLARAAADTYDRIVVRKPTPEGEDVYARLSDAGMTQLKTRFATLSDKLIEADEEPDPVKACKLLQEVFGDEFPVSASEETAVKSSAPAIVTSSSSA